MHTLRNRLEIFRDPHATYMLRLPLTLPFTLRRFFRDGPTVSQAIEQLRGALGDREARFLAIVQSTVFSDPANPYHRLFRHAGCEPGDLERALESDGLENTLTSLASAGVYVLPEEMKGTRDVVRGSLSFRIDPTRLTRRGHARRQGDPAFVAQSSGSTGRPVRTITSTAWQECETPALAAFLTAHDLLDHRFAGYEPMLAGVAAGIQTLNMIVRLGIPIDRWFARQVPVTNPLEAAFFRLTAHQIAWAGTRYGPGYARPETIGGEEIGRIIAWVETEHAAGRRTCIRTVASNATRIARRAIETGHALHGCTFVASGEPVTTGKRRVMEDAGARVIVLWGYEPGPVHVGLGCARPAHGDEMHVLTHSLGVIEHPRPVVEIAGRAIRPLLFTTLYPSASRLQINASNGDFATLATRDCGCGLHAAGLTLHVHDVGSFEKLTGEGLAYSRDDLFELLETTLPDRFGGGPGDYQLVEEEEADGRTLLTLLVDPKVGPLDESELLERLGAELAAGSRSHRFMAAVWAQEGTLRLRRERPIASARGKVLPLRLAQGDREPATRR